MELEGGLNGTPPAYTPKETRDQLQHTIDVGTTLFNRGLLDVKAMEPLYVLAHAVHYLDLYTETSEGQLAAAVNEAMSNPEGID